MLSDRGIPALEGPRQHRGVRLAGGHPGGAADGLTAEPGSAVADFMADHVFNRIDIPSWLARTGFQMMDPLKTAKARVDFVRQLHDREALLPREQQRRFLESEGWIAWSGPAMSELLKQFIAHNRMMTGGFAINGQLVTLTDITCPMLAFVGEVDDIGQPASVRGIRRAAPNAEVYEYLIRTGHFGLVVGSKAATETWPTVAEWVRWLSTGGDKPANIDPMPISPPTHRQRGGVRLAPRARPGRGLRGDGRRWPAARLTRWSRPTSRCARWRWRPPGRCRGWPGWDRSTITPASRWAASSTSRPTTPRTASSCCSTVGCTPTRRSTAASTTSFAA